ncbi:MAG: type II toxin-antitoxin system VapC family toxin [Deltaproteobacteria bacterium]|jgi:predicted nucleic-acid-binding protein|nr:type II toxin-antitoxin system VapC family toxin [Deltaproteobacteria bacterium]
MKGLDTNVLVRYLTQDDRKQSKLVEKEIEKVISSGEKLMIQPIVICELVWVLESAYDYHKSEIFAVLDQIMRTAQFEIIDKDTIWRALTDLYESKGDFADYYIGRANKRSGAIITLTFDKLVKDSEMFSVL